MIVFVMWCVDALGSDGEQLVLGVAVELWRSHAGYFLMESSEIAERARRSMLGKRAMS